MTPTEKLKLLAAWDTEPVLTETEIGDLLVEAAIADGDGLAPEDESWRVCERRAVTGVGACRVTLRTPPLHRVLDRAGVGHQELGRPHAHRASDSCSTEEETEARTPMSIG